MQLDFREITTSTSNWAPEISTEEDSVITHEVVG